MKTNSIKMGSHVEIIGVGLSQENLQQIARQIVPVDNTARWEAELEVMQTMLKNGCHKRHKFTVEETSRLKRMIAETEKKLNR